MDICRQFNISSLIEGFPHAAMLLTAGFRIIAMNRLMEAMTGYTSGDVLGIHGELVIRSNTGNNRSQLYNKVLSSGEAISVSGDLLNCYRRKIAIQYTVSALNDLSGNRCGLLVVAEDISASCSNCRGLIQSEEIELIGYSPKMQEVFDLIPLLAQTDASVMITGETGTGKDKVAEIIHKKSPRARFPFIKVNCGALPPGLLESELFGHVKGAFTGANRNKPGMFELAHRGTLFLTEIGDMDLSLQVKLLSVLDDREFIPVGGEEKKRVDVRIIAATHRPLREQIQKNEFREDLFYRLHVLHVHLPPLREREEDVRYLLDHFLEKTARKLGKTIVGFTPEAMERLLGYHYPGNIRELINIIEYSTNICRKKKINPEMLPNYISEPVPLPAPPPSSSSSSPSSPFSPPAPRSTDSQTLRAPSPAALTQSIPEEPAQRTAATVSTERESRESWEDIEREMIISALKQHSGNRNSSAASLGWGRMKLWRKMKHYGLL